MTLNSKGVVNGPAEAGGQIVVDPNGGFDVQLSYTYAEEFSNRTFSVSVTAADGATVSASTGNFSVADAPLTGSSTATAGGTAGTTGSSVLAGAIFTDANPGNHTGDFTATINWGDDGPTSAGTISYDSSSGVYTVNGSHTYGKAETFPSAFRWRTRGEVRRRSPAAQSVAIDPAPKQTPVVTVVNAGGTSQPLAVPRHGQGERHGKPGRHHPNRDLLPGEQLFVHISDPGWHLHGYGELPWKCRLCSGPKHAGDLHDRQGHSNRQRRRRGRHIQRLAFPATVTVKGVSGSVTANLEGVIPTVTYCRGAVARPRPRPRPALIRSPPTFPAAPTMQRSKAGR